MPSSNPRASHTRLSRNSSPRREYMEALEARLLMIGTYSSVFNSLTLPTHRSVAGFISKGTVSITITNNGNNAAIASDKGEIHVFARPVGAVDSSEDFELGKLLNQNVGFAIGASKSYTVPLTMPANAPVGDYNIEAAFLRTVPTASELGTFLGAADLHATLGTVIFPPVGIVSGGPAASSLQVKLTNDGNIPIAPSEKVTLTFAARPFGGGSDIPLTTVASTANQTLGNLKPGAVKTFTAKVLFPVTVNSGNFFIVATATVNGPSSENNPSNNTVVTDASVPVTQGYLDFGTTLVSAKGAVSIVQGTPSSGSVQAKVTNLGNIKTSTFDSVSVTLVARPEGGGPDILLKSLPNQKFASIKEGTGFKNFTLPYTFAADTPAGTYDLVVTTTPDGPGVDIVPTNDVLTLDQSVLIAPAFVDLTMDETTSTTLAGNVLGGTKGVANAVIRNLGNVPSTGYLVEVFLKTGAEAIQPGDVPVATAQSATAKIAPNGTLKVPVNYTVPGVGSNTTYRVTVRVTLAGDPHPGNDFADAGTITATPIPPVLGNEPSQVTFIEKTYEPVSAPGLGVVQITSTGDLTYPGQAPSNGDGYFYHVITIGPLPKRATLQLGVTPFGLIDIFLDFTGTRLNSLSGKTITFTSSSAGATGKFSIPGDFPLAGVTADMKGFFKIT